MSAAGDAVQVRPVTAADRPAVATIYAEGIATGHATFETAPPPWEALAPASGRCAFRGVAQNSVYVAGRARGRGVGRALLDALIASAESAGIWTLECGIFPENAASIALHERAGFRVLGVRERLGRLGGRWRDVAFLERRGRVI